MNSIFAIPTSLDAADRFILAALQDDAWVPQGAIAGKVGLSEGAVSLRIAKLAKSGVIRRITAVLDDAKVGCDIQAFVEVFVEPAKFEKSFIHAMDKEPEVLEVHHITGEFSLLLKVKTKNRDTLQRLLLERVSSRDGVRRTRTVMVLSTPKEETALPLALLNGKEKTK
jgi:Lrp/AsnC family leucine-responsive transcriptional regulator